MTTWAEMRQRMIESRECLWAKHPWAKGLSTQSTNNLLNAEHYGGSVEEILSLPSGTSQAAVRARAKYYNLGRASLDEIQSAHREWAEKHRADHAS